ncbi:MAG: uracil-DNA glycosylase [Gallionella sp.]|nr:uracil-DNA glycosylase [Gallionella sp.]MDD4958835.1 uracil-DNA glycosylase [Gallionella sp.]
MNRQTAVLRELGLYPLWQRREMPVQVSVGANLFARGEAANHTADENTLTAVRPDPSTSLRTEGEVEGQSASTETQNQAANDAVRPELVEGKIANMVDAVDENRANEFAPTGVVDPAIEIPRPEISPESRANWATLHSQIEICQRCELHAGCLQTVCGTGDPEADWLFIGDWSSEEDDVQGEPFMGAAGKLLDNMLRAIGLNRQQNVYLSNVLKCRPPEQHHSLSSEIEQCLPYLHQQIDLIKPKKIIALGNTAAHALLGGNVPLKTLRGHVHHYQDIPVIVTYHPAYLLRSPLEKAHVWADLCLTKSLNDR